MTTFFIQIEEARQAKALLAFLKTLDSVKVNKISVSKKKDKSVQILTDEMKRELDNRINSLGKEKTYKAEDAISYARKRIRSKN